MPYYVDTSALVKMVVNEPETGALGEWLYGNDALVLTRVTPAMFDQAGRLDRMGLTTLDAVHLAAALDLGDDDLAGVVTYDDRLAAAAEANGVTLVAPR